MINLSPEKIAEYYREYRYQEIGFTKKSVEALGLVEREIRVQWQKISKPCRIHAASLSGVKVELKMTPEEKQSLLTADPVSLMYSFIGFRKILLPITLPVPYLFAGEQDLLQLKDDTYIISLSCSKKPPNLIIGIFGDFLRLNSNVSKRLEERIVINADSAARLGLKSLAAEIILDGAAKQCILQDLSFSGSGCLISAGAAQKPARGVLQILFLDPDAILEIPGKVVRYRQVRSGAGIYFAGLRFDEETVPMEYRKRIDNIFKIT